MDAWLLGLFGASPAKPQRAERIAASELKSEPVESMASGESLVRRTAPRKAHERVAHWDNKRQKCQNCQLIYLKTLSRHAGFCSVDCKSNAAYLAKVNRTIRAVKNAVANQQQDKQSVHAAEMQQKDKKLPVEAATEATAEAAEQEDDECFELDDLAAPHTFADFGRDGRLLETSNVQWAFSAIY